jgi:hypothetical protein
MFRPLLTELEGRLTMPYPERALFLEELAADLELALEERLREGLAMKEARERVLAELGLDAPGLARLESVHLPVLRRALGGLSGPVREGVEAAAVALPLASFVYYLTLEAPMILFVREGGIASFIVLALGGAALLLLLWRGFRWFVLRDHSLASLRLNTSTPLYLAAATLGVGLLGTALGYYVVLDRWAAGAFGDEVLRVGLREPLSCLVLGAALSTLAVLVQGTLQVALRAIRAPAEGAGS